MRNLILVLILFLLSAAGFMEFSRFQQSQPETMPLLPMMQKLLSDVQLVDRGIYSENFTMIKKGAGQIADHPKMTQKDKKRVKETLGEEIKKFVQFDMTVHHHADSMKMSAVSGNMDDVLRHYKIMQQGCVDCHSSFRARISEALKND